MAAPSSGLMDLMDAAPALVTTGQAKEATKRPTALTIQQNVPSSAKAAPAAVAGQKKPISYGNLARAVQELAASNDQKSAQKQLVSSIFPKLAVYSSLDASLGPPLLRLLQVAEDRATLRYVYYYLAKVLADSSSEIATAQTPGGVAANWDAMADLSAGDRASFVKHIMAKLADQASNPDLAAHARRVAALKSLSYIPATNFEGRLKLLQLAIDILDKASDQSKFRRTKKGLFGRNSVDKEALARVNLQYSALAALRHLTLDAGDQQLLAKTAQGLLCPDPVALRHTLNLLFKMAVENPGNVAFYLIRLSSSGQFSITDLSQTPDTFARVYLARLCAILVHSPALLQRVDVRGLFAQLLFQLLLDPSEKVVLEAAMCVTGSIGGEGSPEQRATAWHLLERAGMAIESASEDNIRSSGKYKAAAVNAAGKVVHPALQILAQRLELALRSPSRPTLHCASRAITELGKSRAAAHFAAEEALGLPPSLKIPPQVTPPLNNGVTVLTGGLAELEVLTPPPEVEKEAPVPIVGSEKSLLEGPVLSKQQIASFLSPLMEAVRTTVACECHYVRAAALKAMIWMQTGDESAEELRATLAGELADPSWPTSLLNDLLLTIHARFKATPSMAAILLRTANLWVTLVPSKIEVDVLQVLWKTCLVGCGPEGKHTALEAVGAVLDLPPPKPPSEAGPPGTASDPKSATALERLLQAAVWFLGENANYASSEYAWEPPASSGALLMVMEGSQMIAAAGSRNPALAAALARLQRCAVASSWEVRVVAAQALITVALRSGEPYRLQCYEFLHSLLHGEALRHRLQEQQLAAVSGASSGEDLGGSGSGLANVVAPMLHMLDEIYSSQDKMVRDMRAHTNNGKDWSDEELKELYTTHERLLEQVSLFCFVPKAKYLPLGPTSADLIDRYRSKHHITTTPGTPTDAAVKAGIADLLDPTGGGPGDFGLLLPQNANTPGGEDGLWAGTPPGMDLVNDFLGGATPAGTGAPEAPQGVNFEDMWASSLLGGDDETAHSSGSSSPESIHSSASTNSVGSSKWGQSDSAAWAPQSTILESTSEGRPEMSSPEYASTRRTSEIPPQPSFLVFGDTPLPPPAKTDSPEVSKAAPRVADSVTTISAPSDEVNWFSAGPGEVTSPPVSSATGATSRETRKAADADFFSSELVVPSIAPAVAPPGSSREGEDESPEEPRKRGRALYDFASGGPDELDLKAGDALEIEYEVDGWYHVTKVREPDTPSGLVPVLYVEATG